MTTLMVLVSYLSCEAMKLPSLREDKPDDEVSDYSGNMFCFDWELICSFADEANAAVEEMEKDLKNANDTDADILNESINWMKPILAKCGDETISKKCNGEEELDDGEVKVEEEIEEAVDEGEEKVED